MPTTGTINTQQLIQMGTHTEKLQQTLQNLPTVTGQQLQEEQIKIKEDMIKTIKQKWYENRYLWFFGGVFLTSGTVYLAGQLD